MIEIKNVFVAVYTNECKEYCDSIFFKSLRELSDLTEIHIIDNTRGSHYFRHLDNLLLKHQIKCYLQNINVDKEPRESLFHRNLVESLKILRDEFLKTPCSYFLILESDVIPPEGFLRKMIERLEKYKLGAIGALYHMQYGAHRDNILKPKEGDILFEKECLSGCTLYSRKLIETLPFRYEPTLLGAFHDAIICAEARELGFKFGNCPDIICDHLTDARGTRGHHLLN